MRLIFFLMTLLPLTVMAQTQTLDAKQYTQQLSQRGLRFTENKGQVTDLNGKLRPDILFTAHSAGVKLFITGNGIYYQFSKRFEKTKDENAKEKMPSKFDQPEIDSIQFYRLDMQLVGASKRPEIIKGGEGSDYENYYLAHCPNGIFGVRNYSQITFKNVYPNIDWVVYTKDDRMEYDFVVKPGADINKIKLKYSGAVNIKSDNEGNLVITTPLGTVQEHKPLSFIGNTEIKSNFKLSNNEIGFEVKDWDGKSELKIDPSIVWSTYYGGISGDYGNSCALDNAGNIYMCGYTASPSGIASGGFQNTLAGGTFFYSDAFLVKFNSAGNRLWATYYGGTKDDLGYSCVADNSGNIYMCGTTSSSSGIASGGFQNTYDAGSYNYDDAFLVKFNSSGGRLWATYYGGSYSEQGYSCALDTAGNIYITGCTFSTTGIASGGFQNTLGGANDAFLVKFNSDGNRLWATYYGGPALDEGNSCRVDASGNILVFGYTTSVSGIASGGFQNSFGGVYDAFLVKFNSAGNRLWATYYGGRNYDYGNDCVTDKFGNIYISGQTQSIEGIAFNGFQNVYSGATDAYLVKLDANGNRVWGTYYGNTGYDAFTSCVIDSSGNIYAVGYTTSAQEIAYEGIQSSLGGINDAMVVKFDKNGSRLWATYYGGADGELAWDGAFDNAGNVYICGNSGSVSGIASGGFQNTLGGYRDAFLTKIIEPAPCSSDAPVITASVNNICSGMPVVLSVQSGKLNNAKYWQWYKDICSFNPIDTGKSITVIPSDTTIYYAKGFGGCTPVFNCGSVTINAAPVSGATVNITAENGICVKTNVSAYLFSKISGVSLDDISSGSIFLLDTYAEDVTSSVQTIPFYFNYKGIDYNQFSVSSNGIIGLGSTPITSSSNNLTDDFYTKMIMPLWRDLSTGADGSVRYKVTGEAPNRKLVIEWNIYSVDIVTKYDYRTFQAWLFEGSNVIQFVYGKQNITHPTGATIGIASSYVDYLSVNSSNGGVSSTSRTNNNLWPQSQSFIFSPCSASSACFGSAVKFTANPYEAGSNPFFQWKKNGINTGINSSIYYDSTLRYNDTVWCEMTRTSTPCLLNNLAVSNKISVNTAKPVYAYFMDPSYYRYLKRLNIYSGETSLTYGDLTSGPYNIATLPNSNKVYVTDFNNDATLSFNTKTGTYNFFGPAAPGGICVSPDGKKLYESSFYPVTNDTSTISVYNTDNDAYLTKILVKSEGSDHICISNDGTWLYMNYFNDSAIGVINTLTKTEYTRIKLSSQPNDACTSPDGKKLYVTQNNNKVSVINTLTNIVTAVIAVGQSPRDICISPDGSKIFVANYDSKSVSVISTANNSVITTIPVTANPFAIDISPDGSSVFTASSRININDNYSVTPINAYFNMSGEFIADPPPDCPPFIKSFTAKSVCKGSSINVIGANFAYATSVKIGALNAKSFQVISDTLISAIFDTVTADRIIITGPSGSGISKDSLTVLALPAAKISASGATANVCPGKTVTLTASAGNSYLWSTGATTKSILVNAAGSYTVRITNTKGCSATSDTTKVTYQSCTKPTGLSVSNITNSSAKLNWMPDTCAVAYQYEIRKKGTGTWAVAKTATSNKTITGLSSNTTYQWRVIKACKVSPDTIVSPYAAGPEFTTLVSIAISNAERIIQNSKYQVVPNPTTGNTTLAITGVDKDVTINVIDANGKTVWQKHTAGRSIVIPSEKFSGGVYMITVISDEGIETLKFIRQ